MLRKNPSPNFDETDLEIIGKVITHTFIQHNLFPVELSRASLKHYIFGAAWEEELLSSFPKFLTSCEANIITKFCESKTLEDQPIMDIFNEYSMFHQPTLSNIMSLLAKAAKIAPVKMPCFAMQGLTRGMGPLWEIRRKPFWLDVWLHKLNINECHWQHRCSRAQCLRRKSHYMVEQISKELFETPPASVHPLCNGFFKLFTKYAYKTTICWPNATPLVTIFENVH